MSNFPKSVLRKIWRALFSCSPRFVIRPFALQPTKEHSERYSDPCHISKMERFAKIVNDYFAKHSILDVRQGSEYALTLIS